MAIVILVAAGTITYAQQVAAPTKQDMQTYLNQAKQNASQYEKDLSDIKSRNSSSGDVNTYNRIKGEIDRLESRINTEKTNIKAVNDKGNKVNTAILNNLEQMINQHKDKVAELETFLSNTNTK